MEHFNPTSTHPMRAIAAMSSRLEISSECSDGGFLRNGVLQPPFPDQHQRTRASIASDRITQYVRFPRWGTLVSHDHVARLGGISAIERAVQPALVRELSGGVYFQLTDTVATAMSEEAMEQQRRFTVLAEPLLPLPVPPR